MFWFVTQTKKNDSWLFLFDLTLSFWMGLISKLSVKFWVCRVIFSKKGLWYQEHILNLDLIQDHCVNLSGCQKLSFGSVINSYIKYFFIFNSRLKILYYKSGQNLNGHIMDRQLTTAGLSTLIQPLLELQSSCVQQYKSCLYSKFAVLKIKR